MTPPARTDAATAEVLIPASEYPPEAWPLPTPEQMETLRRLLPPVPVEQAGAA